MAWLPAPMVSRSHSSQGELAPVVAARPPAPARHLLSVFSRAVAECSREELVAEATAAKDFRM
eukprot:7727661-Lingulodinium_polyedra.AAC.1